MAPVTEIAILTVKPDTDTVAGRKVLDAGVLGQPGSICVRWAPSHEDPNVCYAFIDWDRISRHQEFIDSPAYKPFLEQLLPKLAVPPALSHVNFDPYPPTVLNNEPGTGKTAVVEVLNIYLPAGDDFTPEIEAKATSNLKEFLDQLLKSAEGVSGETAHGWALEELDYKGEKAKVLVVLIGWDSVEAHHKFRETEAFGKCIPLIREIPGLKGLSLVHTSTEATASHVSKI